jgi:hypothetical protein
VSVTRFLEGSRQEETKFVVAIRCMQSGILLYTWTTVAYSRRLRTQSELPAVGFSPKYRSPGITWSSGSVGWFCLIGVDFYISLYVVHYSKTHLLVGGYQVD